jgi:hypothetical protein
MRSKFAAAQSGLRMGKSVPFTGFPTGKPVNGTDFPPANSSWSAFRAPDPVIESMTLRPVPA